MRIRRSKRKEGKAFIPVPNEHLRGLAKVNQGMAAFMQKRDPQKIATLDQDATLVETAKRDALFSYKGFKSYQPLNTWWAEQQMVLHTEFRDGNVPAGYEQLRVLKEALALLPEGVEQVRLRSDTAGYQHSLLRYCEEGRGSAVWPDRVCGWGGCDAGVQEGGADGSESEGLAADLPGV